MVVLTIVTRANGSPIRFDPPIPRVCSIKLLSCSLCNSWFNVKTLSEVKYPDLGLSYVAQVQPGHYDLVALKNILESLFSDKPERFRLKVSPLSTYGKVVISKGNSNSLSFGNGLSEFFGVSSFSNSNVAIALDRLSPLSSFFVHCDLLDTRQNLFNSSPSDVLGVFIFKGKSFERVLYTNSSPLERSCLPLSSTNSITLCVKNEKGALIDFNGHSLIFELEIL